MQPSQKPKPLPEQYSDFRTKLFALDKTAFVTIVNYLEITLMAIRLAERLVQEGKETDLAKTVAKLFEARPVGSVAAVLNMASTLHRQWAVKIGLVGKKVVEKGESS